MPKKWPFSKKQTIPNAKKKNEKKKAVSKSQSAASCEEQIKQPKNLKPKKPKPKKETVSTSTVGRIQRMRSALGIKRNSSQNPTNDVKSKKAKNGKEPNFDIEQKKTMKKDGGDMEKLTELEILSEEQRIQLEHQVTRTNTASSSMQEDPGNSSDFSDAKSDFETDSTDKMGIEDEPGCAVSAPALNAGDNEQFKEGTSFEHDPGGMQNQGPSFEHKLNQYVVSINIYLCTHYTNVIGSFISFLVLLEFFFYAVLKEKTCSSIVCLVAVVIFDIPETLIWQFLQIYY